MRWLGLLALAACTRTSENVAPPELVILATGDLGSDTDVCGCKAHPLGGVARRAHLVAQAQRSAPGRVLLLDAGDHFFRSWNLPDRDLPQARATARFLSQTLGQMGGVAVAVGERDLALGTSFLKRTAAEAGLKLLAANLVHAASGTVAFDAWTLVERGGVKVGIVGLAPELSSDAQAYQVYQRNGLATRPLRASVLEAANAARRAGAQLVVALVHLPQRQATDLLISLPRPGVDLALVAQDRLTGPFRLVGPNLTAMLEVGDRGKYLAEVRVQVSPLGSGIFDLGAKAQAEANLKALDRRIADYEKAGATDSDSVANLRRLEQQQKRLASEIEAANPSQGVHLARAKLLEVAPSLPEDPAILGKYRDFQAQLLALNAGVPVGRLDFGYAGSLSCRTCHQAAFAHWSQTPHARAWATLERAHQTGNLDCVPCHATGFDRPGGPRSLVGMELFRDVGCESCHGPASAHAEQPKVPVDYGRQVPEAVCAECHRAQGDQKPFDFEARLPQVLGKGHGQK